jgi:surface carbohydrate biosynthesis protein
MRVAFPVEVKVRDLRSSVWLSLHLLEQGHEVVLGETASIREGLDIIEPDVYIRPGLSQNETKVRNTRIIQEAGGSVVVLQTEGAVFTSDQQYRDHQIQKNMLQYTDLHCAWGERQASMIRDVMDREEAEILTSGHPRFDLLADGLREVYREQAERYHQEYGNYILFNTNFAAVNHASHPASRFDSQKVSYQSDLLSEYTTAVQKLSSGLDATIIVRAHPVEDLNTYRHILSDCPNVYILREGNVRPWILGADAVVHKSSTSGIESALLNTPVFSYRPVKNAKYDADLPIVVSEEINSYNALSEALGTRGDAESYSLTAGQEAQLRSYFHNVTEPVATSLIAKKIDSLQQSSSIVIDDLDPSFEQRIKRLGIRLFGTDFIESVGKHLLGNDKSNVRQKVPVISAADLQSEITALSSLSDLCVSSISIDKFPSLSNTYVLRPRD